MPRLVVLVLILGMVTVSSAEAATWYVTVDGTGDAPTIQAGIDSAAWGDTVLVGPGTYELRRALDVKEGVDLISENGPNETILQPLPMMLTAIIRVRGSGCFSGFWLKTGYGYCALTVPGDDVVISYNIVEVEIGWGGLGMILHRPTVLFNNLVIGVPDVDDGVGILVYYEAVPSIFHNNVILNGVECEGGSFITAWCNDVTMIPGTCIGYSASFSLDPLFCGSRGLGGYYLAADSPCAPGNHPEGEDCGLIGPLPVGCGPVPIENVTWGAIKSLYR